MLFGHIAHSFTSTYVKRILPPLHPEDWQDPWALMHHIT